MKGTALRYGFFYGRGTWFANDGDVANDVRDRKCPLVDSGRAIWSWVHVEDATAATVAALDCAPGVYNIVDNEPSEIRFGSRHLRRQSERPNRRSLARRKHFSALDLISFTMRPNCGAHRMQKRNAEFGFAPRRLEWLMQTGAMTSGR
ncbi:MAG TPA: hypothetical protein VH325_11145 [Bryobacteraceae bacterium]|jgi:nucleoside-diphosphate-sugar epimerase|nr:hypothetical protein [Bryobacteraceae bacterium]